jgi:UDP-N-acetyl-D-glucosamine dehydrogenase
MMETRSALKAQISNRSAVVGVIGLGYVGLPLAIAVVRGGFPVIGFDIDPGKIELISKGQSYIHDVSTEDLAAMVANGDIRATDRFDEIASCNVILICVPTPLTRQREPNLSFVERTAQIIARQIKAGQLIVLESTTFPGTTNQIVKPILESSSLIAGRDFFLGFSPERADPGNTSFKTTAIPKLVAGVGADASAMIKAFYGAVFEEVIQVPSVEVAEAAKITENVFRAVNIALVNELKMIYDAMGIDVWEVIEAASTKPFGFMPFYPGPGLGGHCVPIDPFYLAWKSKEYDLTARFIELAGEINVSMPRFVIGKLEQALDRRQATSLSEAHILIIGLTYKRNVADIRESPSLKLMELLQDRNTRFDFYDPYVSEIPLTRAYSKLAGRKSVDLAVERVRTYHAVLLVTDHDCIDYEGLARHAALIIDTRNVYGRKGVTGPNIVKA